MTEQQFQELMEELQSWKKYALLFLYFFIFWALFGHLKLNSQELPAHPQPQFADSSKVQWAKPSLAKRAETYAVSNDHYLLALDSSLRMMDAKTTHDLLSNPCKCFKEDDPIAPHDGNYVKQAAFQSGMMALVTFGHYELTKHNHPRLAKVLVIADIASESYAVGHNMSLALPKPLPAVPVVAPIVPRSPAEAK